MIYVYADDIILLVLHRYPKVARRFLQEGVSAVAEWKDSVGYSISAQKSSRLHICRELKHRGQRSTPEVFLDGTPIPAVLYARVLGVTLDKKLSLKRHCSITKKALSSRLQLLRTIRGRHISGSRSTLRTVSRAIVDSKIFFGVEMVARDGLEALKILETTYNQAIRIPGNLFPTTPIPALVAEAGELPFRFAAARALVRAAINFDVKTAEPEDGQPTQNTATARNIFLDITGQQLPNVALVHRVDDRRWFEAPPRIDWSIKRTVRAGDPKGKVLSTFGHLIDSKYKDHMHIYTDGSLADGRVGVGATGISESLSVRLPDQCSVFSAEAAGLILATTKIVNLNTKTVIFTDSASCLSAIEAGSSRHPWIQSLDKLPASKNITFCWIPGHCGIPGNERADALADLGRSNQMWKRRVPAKDLINWCSTKIQEAWNCEWVASSGSFLRSIKKTSKPWTDNQNPKTRFLLSRLRVGHTKLTHGHLVESSSKPVCPTCGVTVTVEHVLTTCPRYMDERAEADLPPSCEDALANNAAAEDRLSRFLTLSGLDKLI